MKSTKSTYPLRDIFSKIIFILFIALFSLNSLPAQEETNEAAEKAKAEEMKKKALEQQKKAFEQLKQMGIDIDPNKEMSEEDAKKLKDKILKKSKDWQKQSQQQVDQYNKTLNTVPVHKDIVLGKVPSKEQMLTIAERFFQRSYKQLNAIEKAEFDKDFKAAEKEKFSVDAVRKLGNKGAELITFGDDHYFACVYITSAVKAIPTDTLSVNNFGGYLRIIDSLEVSIPVLLYANELFSESPVILTQLGCSLLELGDEVKAEKYLKLALKFNPDFGQANSALTEVYIRQKKFKEALQQLFAGCKNMGMNYQQASMANQQIQNGYENSTPGDDLKGKEEFWDETQKQTQPSGNGGPMPKPTGKVKMPAFPDCSSANDWLLGGGYSGAVQAYSGFHDYMMKFVEEFGKVHSEKPNIPENAILRDYPNERLALDCITEMFAHRSQNEAKKYHKIIEEISGRVNNAKELYIKNYGEYGKEYSECLKGCTTDICYKECERKFCAKECPNANKFNEMLQSGYNQYRQAFSGMVSKQIQMLNDLYGFTDQWLAKIESPYWSKIYAYEVKRVALGIVGNAFGAYPQAFQFPAKSQCETDCAVYAVPFTEKPEEVNKEKPEGNDCPSHTKFKIPIAICEVGLDCESIEFGCTALASASVKKNFKKKNVTIFVGVGVKGGLGVVDVGAKAGAVVTVSDQGEVQDVGGKIDLTASVGVGAAKVGATSSGSVSVMKGFDSKVDFVGGFNKGGFK